MELQNASFIVSDIVFYLIWVIKICISSGLQCRWGVFVQIWVPWRGKRPV